MTILKLVLFDALIRIVDHLALREHYLVPLNLRRRIVCVLSVLQSPQLNDFVVGGKQLERARFVLVQKLERINLLFKLDRLKMVKLGLVRLNL